MLDEWCPENDISWQMEQAEYESSSLVKENQVLRARLIETEKELNKCRKKLEKSNCDFREWRSTHDEGYGQ